MVQVRVLLIYLGLLSIVTFPVISNPNRPSSATLKVSEIRDRQRDWSGDDYSSTLCGCPRATRPREYIIVVTIILNFALFSYFTTDRFHNQVYPHLVRVLENSLRDRWPEP